MTHSPRTQARPAVKALTWTAHPAGGVQALAAGLGLYRVHANGDDWYLVPDHMGKGGAVAAQADFERRILSAVELHGPFGWLNGHRALSEDSWYLESDPLGNNDEYFAVPLYSLTDPFKEIGKAAAALEAAPEPTPVQPVAAEAVRKFAKAILHGDTTHQDWLLEVAEEFVAGRPLPDIRSSTHPSAGPAAPEPQQEARTLADVIKTIENGEFYADYDQSVSDLGILRAATRPQPVASPVTEEVVQRVTARAESLDRIGATEDAADLRAILAALNSASLSPDTEVTK